MLDEEEGLFVGTTGLFDLPERWFAAVIPVGLVLLATRLVLAAAFDLRGVLRGEGAVETR